LPFGELPLFEENSTITGSYSSDQHLASVLLALLFVVVFLDTENAKGCGSLRRKCLFSGLDLIGRNSQNERALGEKWEQIESRSRQKRER